jgi:zinc/manganese transport system permease protein
VQLVGVYLVFASLIVPALGARNYQGIKRAVFAYLIGIAGYVAGLLLSMVYDLPSGALIVWCLSILAVFVYALGPSDIEEYQQAAQ